MTALHAPNQHDGAGRPSMAILASAPSRVVHHEHQMFDHSRAGQARGLCCGQAPAAYELQDRQLGRGAYPPVLSNSHWPVNSSPLADRRVSFPSWGIRQHSRAVASIADARVFHSARLRGSSPFAAQSVSDELLQNLALSEVHHKSLSSLVTFAGFQISEVSNGRVPNSSGEFHRNEGELPNVCG